MIYGDMRMPCNRPPDIFERVTPKSVTFSTLLARGASDGEDRVDQGGVERVLVSGGGGLSAWG